MHGEPTYAVVFVGLHMDMYSGDWMIHEGPTDQFHQHCCRACPPSAAISRLSRE